MAAAIAAVDVVAVPDTVGTTILALVSWTGPELPCIVVYRLVRHCLFSSIVLRRDPGYTYDADRFVGPPEFLLLCRTRSRISM